MPGSDERFEGAPPVQRAVVGLLVPGAIVAVAVVPWLLWAGRLPDPVAIHWGGGARPDGHASQAAAFGLGAVPAVLAAAGLVVAIHRRRPSPANNLWVFLAAFLGALFAAVSAMTVALNFDAATWRDASMRWWVLALVVVVPLAAGALATAWTALPPAPLAAGSPAARSVPPVAPGGQVAWSGTARSRWPWPVAVALLAGAVAFAFVDPWWPAPLLAVLAAVMALFTSVRVTTGPDGLRVRPGGVGWPSVHLPPDRIAAVEAIDVRPGSWGGWGYRGSLRLMRQAAWLLRAGPGLKLTLTNGNVFVVTVDDADTGAAVLATHLGPPPPAE